MKRIQEAVAAFLEEKTGIPAVSDRSRCRQYPLLAVCVREGGTVLVDGGRQAEHSYGVTVTAASDRDRAEQTELLSSLVPLLLRGLPVVDSDGQRRWLHPVDIRTEDGKLCFSIPLCVRLPEPEAHPGGADLGLMETLHVDF